ncbi:hypothetical protein ITF76_18690 [Acinetobacter baumannii]|nr:hypothetical protein [Acinetobacter baumannii]
MTDQQTQQANQDTKEEKTDSTVQNDSTSTQSQKNDDSQKTEKSENDSTGDDPTKNMTKAQKKVYDAEQKLKLAKQELEKEQEAEKEKNTQDIIKLLDKQKLLEIPLTVWKEHIKEIAEKLKA